MALRKFRCPKCSRTFGMKAHLGRHMTTIHAAAGAAKKMGGVKRGPGRPKGSGGARKVAGAAPRNTK